MIDEDSQKFEGRRREGLFIGYTTSLTNFCSLGGNVVALGAGLAGLDTTLSAGTPQSAGSILYIKIVLAFFCPLVSAIQGYCLLKFPIKGKRLEKLVGKQAVSFKIVPPIPNKGANVVPSSA